MSTWNNYKNMAPTDKEMKSSKVEEKREGEDDDGGPGAAYQAFVVMEGLLEKLMLLDYEEEVLAKHNIKNLSRHYFVSSPYLPSNSGEQFYTFAILAAWLINLAGKGFPKRQKFDDPKATVSNILAVLRSIGVKVDFPPSKLKSGSGDYVCFVLDRLADEALRRTGLTFKRPKYPTEDSEEEFLLEDNAELTLSQVEREMIDETDDEEEKMMDQGVKPSSKLKAILESTVQAEEWDLEVQTALPQLKVSARTDDKDWRIRVDRMHRDRDDINSSLKEAKGFLKNLQEDIGKSLEKVSSREKYINDQLEHLIMEYHAAQAKQSEVKECYQKARGKVMEKTRVQTQINDELEKVKRQIKENGCDMSDGAPVVKIKQSLTHLKEEIGQMDVRIGVVKHNLLQAKLKEESYKTQDMDATNIPEPAAGNFLSH